MCHCTVFFILFVIFSGSILLYAKVDEPAAVKEAAQVWLCNPSNRGLQGFRTVAELYLLHVLLPLELTDQARELIVGELGRATFTEEHQQTALDIIEEKEREKEVLDVNVDCRLRAENASTQGEN